MSRVERKPQVFIGTKINLHLPTPEHFYLGIPQPMYDFYIRAWRAQLEERMKSDDSYARKFLNEVDEMDKKVDKMVKKVELMTKKDFYARARQREERIWGK